MTGVYSIAEVIDDSNKQPEKTIFCYLLKDSGMSFTDGQEKSLDAVGKMVVRNGGQYLGGLAEVAEHLNKSNSCE